MVAGTFGVVAQHGVEDGGVVQVTGHPDIGDGHHTQSRILDLALDVGSDDLADTTGQSAGAWRIGHG